ncbi:MAG: prephenate dehydratase [Chloroflexales bacterium]|nr:prephenate dehydratase [Chloroflexales bacterium]
MRISYLGPAGTYSEIAALTYATSADVFVPQNTFPAAVHAVEQGNADVVMLPIENILEGSVTTTLDILVHDTLLMIRAELVVPINHQLLGKPGTNLDEVEILYGHPQSLGQCRHYIETYLPQVTTIASLSNSAAPAEALASPLCAVAIGTTRAAELTGAVVLVSDIQDRASNVTRFVVLAATDNAPTGDDKTSLCFGFDREDRAGQIVKPLQILAEAGINITKFESRPSKAVLGEYVFFVDINGHRLDPHITATLDQMRAHTGFLKIFGSYPRWHKN